MERGFASSHKGDEDSLSVRGSRGRSLLQSVPSFENSPPDCFQNSPLAERPLVASGGDFARCDGRPEVSPLDSDQLFEKSWIKNFYLLGFQLCPLRQHEHCGR